jgi:hypothetical protein
VQNFPSGDCQNANYNLLSTMPANTVKYSVSSVQPNTYYCLKLSSFSGDIESTPKYSAPVLTAASSTVRLVTGTPTKTSVNLRISQGLNPAWTEYSIFNKTANLWVQPDGTLGATAHWETFQGWGGSTSITNSSLKQGTDYRYLIYPRNSQNIVTPMVAEYAITTLATYYQINLTNNGHGRVSPSSSQQIMEGNSLDFTFTPDNGFVVENVIVDGVNMGTISSYSLNNIMANHNISVVFGSTPSYVININGDENASYPTGKNFVIKSGDSILVQFGAQKGYRIKNVVIDGQSFGHLAFYHFYDVKSNHEILVQTEKASAISPLTDKLTDATKAAANLSKETIFGTSDSIKGIVSSLGIPINNVSQAVSLASIVTAIATLPLAPIANATSLLSLQEILRSLWQLITGFLGVRRSRRKSGRVTEAGSNMPISQAKVELYRMEQIEGSDMPVEKLITTTYTDKEGYYGFVAEPGKYLVRVSKEKYQLDLGSSKVVGAVVEIKNEEDGLLVPNISLSMKSAALKRTAITVAVTEKIHLVFAIISFVTLVAGSIVVVEEIMHKPTGLTYALAAFYCLIWAINLKTLVKKSPWGIVMDSSTNMPLPLVLVRIMDDTGMKLIKTSVTNKDGKYSVLVPKGKYMILASKSGYKQTRLEQLNTTDKISAVNRRIEMEQT